MKNEKAKIAKLITRAGALQQGEKSVVTYANELSDIFSELDHYRPPDLDSQTGNISSWIKYTSYFKDSGQNSKGFAVNYATENTSSHLTMLFLNYYLKRADYKI